MAEITFSKGVVVGYCPLILGVLTKVSQGHPVEGWQIRNALEEMRRIQHYLLQTETK